MVRFVLTVCLLSCSLPAQEPAASDIERVGRDYKFTEGPVWSPDGFLLFTDIPTSRILKFEPEKGASTFREPSGNANGLAFDAQGRLYVCEGGARRVTRIDRRGKVEVLADKWEGKRLNAPNDVVVRKDGNVYFTDPAFGSAVAARELDFYGVYRITQKGQLELIARLAGRPNGIALSPGGRTLYVTNTDERNVRAYDLDKAGAASNERVIISNIEGAPDGMKTDQNGNLYIAAKGVAVYSPQGRLLRTINLPETPANCAFGDPDGESLYVTARTSLYRVRLNAKGAMSY